MEKNIKNGAIIDASPLKDATSYSSYGGRLTINDGDYLEISFEDSNFDGFRNLELISTQFSSTGIKVSYLIKKIGENNYLDTGLVTSTSFSNTASFHSLSNLSNQTDFCNVKSLKLVFTLLPESTALNINIKELDIFLKEDPTFVKNARDDANNEIRMPKLFSNHMILKHFWIVKLHLYIVRQKKNKVQLLKSDTWVTEIST